MNAGTSLPGMTDPHGVTEPHALPSVERDEEVVLELLLEAYPAHLAVEELVRELGGWAAPARVEDTLDALRRAGLVHRHAEFAFASRAARRARELSI